jgi:uncharacterized protein (TIGR02611 family)
MTLHPESLPPPDAQALEGITRIARKIVVSVIGATVVLAGVAMLVLPGPGWLTIAVGIGILGTEFVWAARVYKRIKRGVKSVKDALMPTFFGKASRPRKDPS